MLRILAKFGHAVSNAIYNLGLVGSYAIFPESYLWYKFSKLVAAPLIGKRQTRAFRPGLHSAAVLGFRHSSNIFTVNAISSPCREKIFSYPRLWTIVQATRSGVRPVILFREPRDVLVSTLQRNAVGWYKGHLGHPYVMYQVSVLACWWLFYTKVLRYRSSIILLPFELIASETGYERARTFLQQATEIVLCEKPDSAFRNTSPFPDYRPEIEGVAHFLLCKCDRLHKQLMAASEFH